MIHTTAWGSVQGAATSRHRVAVWAGFNFLAQAAIGAQSARGALGPRGVHTFAFVRAVDCSAQNTGSLGPAHCRVVDVVDAAVGAVQIHVALAERSVEGEAWMTHRFPLSSAGAHSFLAN